MVDVDALMAGLRALCATLPESEEYVMHGHPSFRVAKKPFLIVGDRPADASLSVKVALTEQPFFVQDPRFTRTHYIGQHGWITLDLVPGIDWEELRVLVTQSYRRVASKKALKAHDALLVT